MAHPGLIVVKAMDASAFVQEIHPLPTVIASRIEREQTKTILAQFPGKTGGGCSLVNQGIDSTEEVSAPSETSNGRDNHVSLAAPLRAVFLGDLTPAMLKCPISLV